MRASFVSAAFVVAVLALCPLLASSQPALPSTPAASSPAVADGLSVHSSSSGTGPRTLVLVHGWTCDERTWQAQVPDLSKDYRVITVDLPGHGKTGMPADGTLSVDLFARAIEAVRVQHKADRVVLVGHSMGAIAILQYARMYPERAAALVIVDGSVSMPSGAARDQLLSMAAKYGASLDARETMVYSMFSPRTSDEVRKQVFAMTLAAPAATPLAAMQAFVEPSLWKEDVFRQPVLAVFSGAGVGPDEPESSVDYMKRRFPRLEYFKMDDAGHFLMLEEPAEFNRLLRSFLEKLTD